MSPLPGRARARRRERGRPRGQSLVEFALIFPIIVLLVAGFAIVLVALGPALAHASPWVPVAAALLAVASMAVVRLLLQVDDVTEQTLAICNANRHVGLWGGGDRP